MLKINIKKDYVPIPFVDDDGKEIMELRFYKTDDNVQRILNYAQELEESRKEDKSDEPNLVHEKERTRKAIDATLGDGSFEKMYAISESLILVNDYYAEIAIGLLDELGLGEAKESLDKYRRG